jgi:hypothetical protein
MLPFSKENQLVHDLERENGASTATVLPGCDGTPAAARMRDISYASEAIAQASKRGEASRRAASSGEQAHVRR